MDMSVVRSLKGRKLRRHNIQAKDVYRPFFSI